MRGSDAVFPDPRPCVVGQPSSRCKAWHRVGAPALFVLAHLVCRRGAEQRKPKQVRHVPSLRLLINRFLACTVSTVIALRICYVVSGTNAHNAASSCVCQGHAEEWQGAIVPTRLLWKVR
eukprot:3899425-Rhodomonas_salina.1